MLMRKGKQQQNYFLFNMEFYLYEKRYNTHINTLHYTNNVHNERQPNNKIVRLRNRRAEKCGRKRGGMQPRKKCTLSLCNICHNIFFLVLCSLLILVHKFPSLCRNNEKLKKKKNEKKINITFCVFIILHNFITTTIYDP